MQSPTHFSVTSSLPPFFPLQAEAESCKGAMRQYAEDESICCSETMDMKYEDGEEDDPCTLASPKDNKSVQDDCTSNVFCKTQSRTEIEAMTDDSPLTTHKEPTRPVARKRKIRRTKTMADVRQELADSRNELKSEKRLRILRERELKDLRKDLRQAKFGGASNSATNSAVNVAKLEETIAELKEQVAILPSLRLIIEKLQVDTTTQEQERISREVQHPFETSEHDVQSKSSDVL